MVILRRSRVFADFLTSGVDWRSIWITNGKNLASGFHFFCRDVKTEADKESRVLEVGLMGIPNAGKSELVNHLVEQKISAVSSKQNTTVTSHLGAYEERNTQIVLYDLPGIVRSKDYRHKGQQARVESAWSRAHDCDVIAFIVDAASIIRKVMKGELPRAQSDSGNPAVLLNKTAIEAIPVFSLARELHEIVNDEEKQTKKKSPRLILALNKIDLVESDDRYKLAYVEELFKQSCPFQDIFHLSALRGHGLSSLKEHFISIAHEGEWILPTGAKTDKSLGQLAVELVREKLYRRLNQELPYTLNPELVEESMTESGSIYLEILILVPSENVKKIVVGQRGCIIDSYVIGRVRKELESILTRRFVLKINVKVKKR